MTLAIVFNDSTKTYAAGQCVAGNIVIQSDSETNTKGIKVKVVGKVKVSWKKPMHKRTRRENNISRYTDGNLLLNYKFYILGDGTDNVTIPAGRQVYPFWFNLPRRLPSSFIGTYGYVTYEVEAIIRKSWRLDERVKEGIKVVGILNLNHIRSASNAVEVRHSKTVGLHCCPSGSVHAVLKIPRTGFVVGDQLPIEVHIQNESSSRVTGIKFKLTQHCTYHAMGEITFESKSLPTLVWRGVSSRSNEILQENLLTLPPVLPPTDLRSCRLIHIHYDLSMKVVIRWPNSNFTLSTPIIIGTVPLHSIQSHQNPENITGPVNGQPPAYHPPHETIPEFYPEEEPSPAYSGNYIPSNQSSPSLSLSHDDLPPPSYEDAVANELGKLSSKMRPE